MNRSVLKTRERLTYFPLNLKTAIAPHMAKKITSALKLFLIFLCLISSACSLSDSLLSEKPSPRVAKILLDVSYNYLYNIAAGNHKQAVSSMYIVKYVGPGKDKLNLEDLALQLSWAQLHWTGETSPLIGFTLTDIKELWVRENDATVAWDIPPARRIKGEPERAWVKLSWNGSGWIVKEDFFIGRGKLVERLMKKEKDKS